MRLLAILGLCLVVGVAYAGDGDDRYCDDCDMVNDVIYPTEDYQVVEGCTMDEPNDDYAYSFCAAAGGFYRFTFCEGGGWADFDTALSVQPDGCGPYLACNDDYCGLQSQVDFTAPTDGTYVVVVDGFGSSTGNYGLAYQGPSGPSPADDTAWGTIKALFR
ncbi:MAG: hypothetical protein GF330_09605 [Candidatus Eisenbacteria bacterium]|nr:hypothetical protein [Candidatus Eisenbacteria bacterium]